jgi:hypothetical protein
MTPTYVIPTRSAVLFSLLVLLTVNPTFSQRLRNAHGFRQSYPGAIAIGFAAGANFNLGIEGPKAECDCTFDGGSDIGYHAGIHFDIMISRSIALRLQGLYEDHSTVYVKDYSGSTFGEDGAPTVIALQRRAEVGLQYFSTSFMLAWLSGPRGLYFLAGAGAGFFLDGTIRDEEFIVTPGYVYPESGSSATLFRDEALDVGEEIPVRAGLLVGIGYDLPLGRGVSLAPELQFDFPLTSVVDSNSKWNIPTLRTSMALRFGI